jgi:catalase
MIRTMPMIHTGSRSRSSPRTDTPFCVDDRREEHVPLSEPKQRFSRRDVLATVGGFSLAGAIGSTLVSSSAAAAAETQPPQVTAPEVVKALEGAFGVHPGQRRNHTKGTGAIGSFVGTPEAAMYSRSALFSGNTIEVVARFSVAGGNPMVHDAQKNARGMALEFRLPNGVLHHMTMLNTPMFFAKMPRTFYDMFIALAPDPATGKPDPKKYAAFAATHPDNTAQATFLQDNNPPTSFANSAFYGVHTFKFIDRNNKVTMVRFRFVPQDGERRLSDAELKSMPADFLEQALIQRTRQGAVHWDMLVTIGEPGDPEIDPTVLWPKTRKEFKAGTLTIASAMPQKDSEAYKINFDPIVMADGIEPTDDPILHFRSPAYAVSYIKRIRGQ